MIFFSSFPKYPSSPACGFKPQTVIFGCLTPNLFTISSMTVLITFVTLYLEIAFGTSIRGKWVVTSAILRFRHVNNMTGESTLHILARYSV